MVNFCYELKLKHFQTLDAFIYFNYKESLRQDVNSTSYNIAMYMM